MFATAGALVAAGAVRGLATCLGFGFFGAVTTISGMLARDVGLFVSCADAFEEAARLAVMSVATAILH